MSFRSSPTLCTANTNQSLQTVFKKFCIVKQRLVSFSLLCNFFEVEGSHILSYIQNLNRACAKDRYWEKSGDLINIDVNKWHEISQMNELTLGKTVLTPSFEL